MKGPCPSFKASYHAGKSSSALWLLWRAKPCKVATRVGTSSQSDQWFLVGTKRPYKSLAARNLVRADVAKSGNGILPAEVTTTNVSMHL